MKTPEMEKFLNDVSKSFFGRERDGAACVSCGSKSVNHNDFRDDLSRNEWRISCMCQKCQDSVFGGEGE